MAHIHRKTFYDEPVVFTGVDQFADCEFVRCHLTVKPNPLVADETPLVPSGRYVDCTFRLEFTISTLARWRELQGLLPLFVPPQPRQQRPHRRGRFYKPAHLRRRLEEMR
jgi:hypothetical protein